MMQPHKVSFYLYADNPQQVQALEQALREFVESKRSIGVAVTATALSDAISAYSDNYFLTQYLKTHARKTAKHI